MGSGKNQCTPTSLHGDSHVGEEQSCGSSPTPSLNQESCYHMDTLLRLFPPQTTPSPTLYLLGGSLLQIEWKFLIETFTFKTSSHSTWAYMNTAIQRHTEELNARRTDLLLLIFVYQIQKQGVASGIVGQGNTAVTVRSKFAAEMPNGKIKINFVFL